MTEKYGVYGMHIEPTRRQRIFGEVKEKAQKCKDMTQLCAAIYPWILDLVRELATAGKRYNNLPVSTRNRDSFQNELNDFRRGLSNFISGIPFIIGESKPLDLDRLRSEALDSAVDTALEIAREDVCQISINLSAIMAHFVDEI